jgi:ubiquinone/menaquinone biosynthesis C-methylase UbiE
VPHLTDQSYLLNEQYKDASHFNARIQLHARFSVNKQGWHRWLFEQFAFPAGSRVLELGCGPALLWRANLDRLADDWQITLSDFSPGMLQEAQQTLGEHSRRFQFQQIDAQAIPFADASLDVIIANHMLYHVPDRPKALSEMRRVLKPDGRLYASTLGEQSMREIGDWMRRLNPAYVWRPLVEGFTLENGAAQIASYFASVTRLRYEDALEVTEVEPVLDYLRSGRAKDWLTGERLARLRALLEQELAAQGALHITKDSGLFVAAGYASR